MKKLRFIFMMTFVTLALAAGLGSCSDDDELGSKRQLVGTWEQIRLESWEKTNGEIVRETEYVNEIGDRIVGMKYAEDGSFYYWKGNILNIWREGEWDYKDGKIYYTDTYFENSWEDKVVKLTSQWLEIEVYSKRTESGRTLEQYSKTTYHKVKE